MTLSRLTPVLCTPEPCAAFSEADFAFCSALSSMLLNEARFRPYPELLALGFWLRKASLAVQFAPYLTKAAQYRPLGTVFHNAPSNVDSLFIYSGIVSLLCGNINIIRLSRRAGQSAGLLVELLNELAGAFPAQVARLQLIRCEPDSSELATLISSVDGRVMWGGDEAIARQRLQHVSARCRDLVFNHKFSLVLLGAEAVASADEQAFARLIEGMARDTLTFAQQGCSSAKAVVWFGDTASIHRAQARFWPAMAAASDARSAIDASESMDALLQAQELVIVDDSCQRIALAGPLVRLQVAALSPHLMGFHRGRGLFAELCLSALTALNPMLNADVQTLAVWGVDDALLKPWYGALLCGVDRLVPVGRALEFALSWDGQDLVHAFSRVR